MAAEGNSDGAKKSDKRGDGMSTRHKGNSLFWKWANTDACMKASGVEEKHSLGLKSGDDISMEGGVETTMKKIQREMMVQSILL